MPGVHIHEDTLVGSPAKVICSIKEIKNKSTGESVYPWRYTFKGGMPGKILIMNLGKAFYAYKEAKNVYNCSLIKLKDITDRYGHLTPIESKIDIPFEIKRVYYITRVEQRIGRGFHSHRKLHQILICLNGSVKIKTKSPNEEEITVLNDPSIGLYIGPYVWREMFDFTEDSVLLVLASEYYDENDYIRNYDFYLEEAEKRYR